jgi:hypothetical protein
MDQLEDNEIAFSQIAAKYDLSPTVMDRTTRLAAFPKPIRFINIARPGKNKRIRQRVYSASEVQDYFDATKAITKDSMETKFIRGHFDRAELQQQHQKKLAAARHKPYQPIQIQTVVRQW